MPLHPGWTDLGLRLLLTLIAGALIGFNRGETGHAAGLRTTILVCLAASVAMMQANILLPMAGKPIDSFIVIDLGRWPLGILTGVGFIGAGAILRRGNIVQGVTTAATMWFVTVIGLCFGGGQLWLGTVGTAIGLFVLWVMKWVDNAIPHARHAQLWVLCDSGLFMEDLIRKTFGSARYRTRLVQSSGGASSEPQEYQFEVSWSQAGRADTPLANLERLRKEPGVRRVTWKGPP